MIDFSSDDSGGRNVVCTGIGMITPLGIGREESWSRLLNGDLAARLLKPDEIDHHAQLSDLLRRTPAGACVDHAAVRAAAESATDRSATPNDFLADPLNNLIIVSVAEALSDAGLDIAQLKAQRTGCVVGTSKASLRAMEDVTADHANGNAPDAAQWLHGFLSDAPLRAAVSMLGGAAETATPVAACATGLVSVIQAAELIRSGRCDVCLAGSADASLRSSVLASFHRLGVTSKNSDPATACRPFDANRDGFVIGEGAAVFVLESVEHAQARNASTYGQLLAANWMTDPTGVTQVDSSGRVVAEAVRLLLQSKRWTAVGGDSPEFCCLHGTATIPNDLAEANGLASAMKGRVTAFGVKGAIGHLLGAAGSVEFAATLLALRDRVLPATANLQTIDPDCPIDVSRHGVKTKADRAIKLSLGFGGHVAAVLVGRC